MTAFIQGCKTRWAPVDVFAVKSLIEGGLSIKPIAKKHGIPFHQMRIRLVHAFGIGWWAEHAGRSLEKTKKTLAERKVHNREKRKRSKAASRLTSMRKSHRWFRCSLIYSVITGRALSRYDALVQMSKSGALVRDRERCRRRYSEKYATDQAFRAQQIQKVGCWKKKNVEANRAHGHVRRVRVRNGRRDSFAIIAASVKKAKSACYWCGCALRGNEWHMDHVTPLARGGEHAAYNIVKSCQACNLRKHDSMPGEINWVSQPCLL